MRVIGFDRRGREVLSKTVKVAAGTSIGVKFGSKVRYLRLIADEPLEPALRRFLVTRRGAS